MITDKKGKTVTDGSGIPKVNASHSYLIKPTISNERNKAAVEMVHAIVTLIEQAGNHIPHIRASTLISQNPLLKTSLANNGSTSHINQTLKRTFYERRNL